MKRYLPLFEADCLIGFAVYGVHSSGSVYFVGVEKLGAL